MPAKKTETPIHEWTNGGNEILVLRFADKDGKSYGGFQHPMAVGETVTAPDWKANAECGGGIHGWAWGIGIGDGKDPDWVNGLWQVYAVDSKDVVGNIGGDQKCKFKTGTLRFVGDWHGAMQMILAGQMAWVFEKSKGAASNSGYQGAASSTALGTAAICTGLESKAMAAEYGCIALAWWNEKQQRVEMKCAEIGNGKDKKLKPNVWYKLNAKGQFVLV